jgi:glycosyltransferase involved in cell wall biosynthesis
MLLSIIIPTLNEQKNIDRLLNSIINNYSFDPKIVEILIVNSPNSIDNTREVVKSYRNIRYYTIGNKKTYQYNYGATLAKGEYLFFVDPNMEFTKTLLATILFSLDPQFILRIPEKIMGKSIYLKARNLEKNIYSNHNSFFVSRIYSKYLFNAIGRFNKNMVFGEEYDLEYRALDAGKQIKQLQTYINVYKSNIGFLGNLKRFYQITKINLNYGSLLNRVVYPQFKLIAKEPLQFAIHPIIYSYLFTLKLFQVIIFTSLNSGKISIQEEKMA